MSQSRGVQLTSQADKGSILMLPFFLMSYLMFLPTVLAKTLQDNPLTSYPISPNRYSEYGWNRQAQSCYTDAEIILLRDISEIYQSLLEKRDSEFFQYVTETSWHDWWQCTKPLYKDLIARLETGVFTLPSHEKQDAKIFPLWDFADNMARQIANWQAERSKNQFAERMNDPVMLMFEELKNWFLHELTQQECRPETLDVLAQRLSHIKILIHRIPDFGLDKPHLLEIQRSLDHAATLIKNCIANKELPQLLSDLIRTGTNLENNMLNTLHFLLINEAVTDNFSTDCLEGKSSTQASPICKIYKAAQKMPDDSVVLPDYQGLHQFYTLINLSSDEFETQFKLQLRPDVVKDIKFASFVSEQDKLNYIEAIATLDALINVRKLLDKFHNLQSKLGTYMFAVNYIDKANELARLYVQLINKSKLLMKSLIITSEDGYEKILRTHDNSNKHDFFRRNLRTLETLVVTKGTTVTSRLELDCAHAITSMEKYQHALGILAADIHSGHAYDELKIAMQELDLQMQYMNTIIPGMLSDNKVKINEQSGLRMQTSENRADGQCVLTLSAAPEPTAPTLGIDLPPPRSSSNPMTQFNFFPQKNETSPSNVLFDYGEWDPNITHHPETQAPLFVYRLFRNGEEVGSATFYNQPILCLTEDGSRNNIVHKTGVLCDFHTEGMTVEEICADLPPTLFDKVLFSAGNGALRGASNVIGATLRAHNFSDRIAYTISQTVYYGSIFGMKFNNYYQKLQEFHDSNDIIEALYLAAIDTGQLILINAAFSSANYFLNLLGNFFVQMNCNRLGDNIKRCGSLLRFGFYAANSTDLPDAGIGIVTGASAEILTEKTGNYLLGNH